MNIFLQPNFSVFKCYFMMKNVLSKHKKQLLLWARLMPTGSSLRGQQAKRGVVNCHACYRVGGGQWWINNQEKPEQGLLLVLHLSWAWANNKMMSGLNQSDCFTFCINNKCWPKVTKILIKCYLHSLPLECTWREKMIFLTCMASVTNTHPMTYRCHSLWEGLQIFV